MFSTWKKCTINFFKEQGFSPWTFLNFHSKVFPQIKRTDFSDLAKKALPTLLYGKHTLNLQVQRIDYLWFHPETSKLQRGESDTLSILHAKLRARLFVISEMKGYWCFHVTILTEPASSALMTSVFQMLRGGGKNPHPATPSSSKRRYNFPQQPIKSWGPLSCHYFSLRKGSKALEIWSFCSLNDLDNKTSDIEAC